jgi:hypothetical protein
MQCWQRLISSHSPTRIVLLVYPLLRATGGPYTTENLEVLTSGAVNCVAGGQDIDAHPVLSKLRAVTTAIVYKHDVVPRALGPWSLLERVALRIRAAGGRARQGRANQGLLQAAW